LLDSRANAVFVVPEGNLEDIGDLLVRQVLEECEARSARTRLCIDLIEALGDGAAGN
jgi:hypothetical protein